MINISPLTQTDFYKVSHYRMYPENTVKIYSNLTPRKSRLPGVNKVVVFGPQYLIKEYLIKQWNDNFFNQPKEVVIGRYKRMMDYTLGKDSVDIKHLEDLWDLQYLPLEIKALPEGSMCPIGVPMLTITNTVDHAYWLVNYLETIMSAVLWGPMTSATIANEYRKLLSKYAMETTGSIDFVQWQGHDFSMRGMMGLEAAVLSGMGHLTSFTGTDTIPAIEALEQYYNADIEKELVGSSVPATEHSVMCMGTKDSEINTFSRLLDLYPADILSVVSDTWDLWKVCTEYLPALKDKILAREGKLVIRPDSGNPVDILCGKDIPSFKTFEDAEKHFRNNVNGNLYYRVDGILRKVIPHSGTSFMSQLVGEQPEDKGVIELLWDVFGGTINEQGYKVLDPHIGAIYGDSITLDRAKEICERLKAKGFASTNVVFGIGSFTYQGAAAENAIVTRDLFGFAVKATYGEVVENFQENPGDEVLQIPCSREIFKDPITDDGTKKSAKGLLTVKEILVEADSMGKLKHQTYQLKDQCSWGEEQTGALKRVFKDGKLVKEWSLQQIRDRIKAQS